jgi:hypothetical protein
MVYTAIVWNSHGTAGCAGIATYIMVTWWFILIKLESLVWLWTTFFLFGIKPIIFESGLSLLSVACGVMLMLCSDYALIMPYFLFCDVIYSHTSLAELLVNLMSHLILVLATYTVCRDFRAFPHSCRILGVLLNDYFDFRMNMMTYRLLQKHSPSYLLDRF